MEIIRPVNKPISKEELLSALNRHREQLKECLNDIEVKCNNIDTNKAYNEIYEKVCKIYLKLDTPQNIEIRSLIQSLKQDLNKYYEEKSKVENAQASKNIFSRILIPYRKKVLEEMRIDLIKKEDKIKKLEQDIFSNFFAKRYIDHLCIPVYKRTPEYKSYMELMSEKKIIDKKIQILNELDLSISYSEQNSFFIKGDIEDLDNITKQVSDLRKQLSEFYVSIREFEKAVDNYLEENIKEHEEILEKFISVSKNIANQFADNILHDIKRVYAVGKVVNYDEINKRQHEIKSVQSIVSNIENFIRSYDLEKLPEKIREAIKKTPEYQCLTKIKNEQTVLKNYKSLTSSIYVFDLSDLSIKIKGSSLSRETIIKQEDIVSQLNDILIKHKF